MKTKTFKIISDASTFSVIGLPINVKGLNSKYTFLRLFANDRLATQLFLSSPSVSILPFKEEDSEEGFICVTETFFNLFNNKERKLLVKHTELIIESGILDFSDKTLNLTCLGNLLLEVDKQLFETEKVSDFIELKKKIGYASLEWSYRYIDTDTFSEHIKNVNNEFNARFGRYLQKDFQFAI